MAKQRRRQFFGPLQDSDKQTDLPYEEYEKCRRCEGFLSAKSTVLTENDDVLSSKFESEPANYTVEQLKHRLSVGVSNRREKGKTYSHM